MDSINFITELNRQLKTGLTDRQLADAMYVAALETLQKAVTGVHVQDTLTREQIATILAAMQWNVNSVVRTAIKAR